MIFWMTCIGFFWIDFCNISLPSIFGCLHNLRLSNADTFYWYRGYADIGEEADGLSAVCVLVRDCSTIWVFSNSCAILVIGAH
jgi:hypothetical protein